MSDGVELLEYMRRQDRYAAMMDDPLPRLVLLDLNMPLKDGREALFEIKSDPAFWRTPIIIFSHLDRLDRYPPGLSARCQFLHHQALKL